MSRMSRIPPFWLEGEFAVKPFGLQNDIPDEWRICSNALLRVALEGSGPSSHAACDSLPRGDGTVLVLGQMQRFPVMLAFTQMLRDV